MKFQKFSEEHIAKYWDENSKRWAEQVRKGWDGYREYFNNPAFLNSLTSLQETRLVAAVERSCSIVFIYSSV